MHLQIITPEKIIYDDEIDEFTVETVTGQIGILPHHINLMTQLLPGELVIKAKNKKQYLGITGGFLEVTDNNCTILADYAIRSEEVEIEKAVSAQKRAEAVLKNKRENISERDFALAQSEMRRSILQLNVANRHRRRRTT